MDINNLEKFKTKMASGRACVGSVITMSDPITSELSADCGMDFTWIDAEHGPFSLENIQGHIMALRGTGCAPLVRVAWNDYATIKPVLDLTPAGIIIPMVNSAEEALEAVVSCKYPPQGRRGCGVRRGTGYGSVPFEKYLQIADSEPMVIVQIEHIDAVSNLDAILEVPGIDSICVGPNDLSGSIGKLGQTSDPEVVQIIEEICRKTRESGLLLGTASAPYDTWVKRGVNWIAMTSDWGAMAATMRSIAEAAQ